MKLNFIKSEQKLLKWKQVEIKNGSLFMRYKQRTYLRGCKYEEC
ncbi:MAG: hypothetical protein QXG86_01770 [Candidatus Woesearchaeota archaeon]